MICKKAREKMKVIKLLEREKERNRDYASKGICPRCGEDMANIGDGREHIPLEDQCINLSPLRNIYKCEKCKFEVD